MCSMRKTTRKNTKHRAAVDSQAATVYEWESEFADWNRRTDSIRRIRSYVRTACAHYGLKAPAVRNHGGKTWPYCAEDGSHISFSQWGQNVAVALHEAAHFIVLKLAPRAKDHGPTWLGVYLWLLNESGTAPTAALAASARAHGLHWHARPPSWFKCKS